MTVENIAKVCHSANKALCETQGDTSQAAWNEASDEFKASSISGVQYRIDNPGATPEDQHNQWYATRKADGWKYGPVKNVGTKENPAFVPYNELPESQKAKDYLFVSIVDSLKGFLQAT